MDNMNIAQNTAIAESFLEITDKTTLGELLAMLNLGEKPMIPTPKALFEEDKPIANMSDCTLFRNGFAIYKNGTGRTVVWLPYCTSFTFYFNKLQKELSRLLSADHV